MALLWRAKDLPLSGGLWDQIIPPTAPSHGGVTDFQWLSLKPLGHTTQNEDNYTCREQDPRGCHAENTKSPYSGPYSLLTLLTALQLSTETPSSCVRASQGQHIFCPLHPDEHTGTCMRGDLLVP